jgi:FK506-binding protein 4/5
MRIDDNERIPTSSAASDGSSFKNDNASGVVSAESDQDITEKKDGGMLKKLMREGNGDERPSSGDTVYVHYVGTLLDGTKFDSSRDRGEKFSFEVGKGAVIKGWDIGVPTMKRGELARFTIRSDYGYGATGSPPTIPSNATLVFEIELFDFHGEDLTENKDKSIIRRIIKHGTGYSSPNEGARVFINLKGTEANTGRVFDVRSNLEFELGEGLPINICEGLEVALKKFKKEERSLIYLKPSQAWGSQGNKELNVAENAEVIYEIELISFEKAKESWQLNSKEKLEQSEMLKNKGASQFKVSSNNKCFVLFDII